MQSSDDFFQIRIEKQSQHDDSAVIHTVSDVLEFCSVPEADGEERGHLRDENRKQLSYTVAQNASQ